ncbi:MAG: hypothetical protein M1569_02950 [Candidatus Marsarchaeota archaeon]|nr:hypothetical protein [Candidatus Marsarchaeota archaeon]MCL5413335.1 hypothetical protein [Candidatus Marsarchaeota archaeon]
MIIASDSPIAIPLALASISLLFAGIYGSQSYLSSYSLSEYSSIRYYSISQQMISAEAFAHGSYQNGTAIAGKIAHYYNASLYITDVNNYGECAHAFCRVIEISGITRLAVIR